MVPAVPAQELPGVAEMAMPMGIEDLAGEMRDTAALGAAVPAVAVEAGDHSAVGVEMQPDPVRVDEAEETGLGNQMDN